MCQCIALDILSTGEIKLHPKTQTSTTKDFTMFSKFFKSMSCKSTTTVTNAEECYDELAIVPFEVVILTEKCSVTMQASYDSDLYEAVEFLFYQNFKGTKLTPKRVFRKGIHWSFTLHGKLIPNRGLPLSLYNARDGSTFQCVIHSGLGGSQEENPEPIWFKEVAVARQREILIENEKRSRKRALTKVRSYLGKYDYELQNGDESSTDSSYKHLMDYFYRIVRPNQLVDRNSEFLMKIIEDISILMFQLTHATTKTEMLVASVAFLKLRTGKSIHGSINYQLIVDYLDAILDSYDVQSMDETFTTAREFLDKYEALRNAPIFKKLYRFCQYALSLSMFEWAGITFNKFNYTKIEEESMRREFHMGPDFFHCMFDTLLFICERGFQCMKSGNLDPIYHSGSSYEKWYDKAMLLKSQAKLMSDPEAHGLNKFSFLKDLNDIIDQGRTITKYAAKLSTYEKSITRTMLGEMETLRCTELSKRAAQKSRRAPFPLLLSGGSSVGKSTLLDLVFYQIAKTFDYPSNSEFKYTRICSDPFWSGYDPSMWFVTLDDIGSLNPNVASGGGDPSLTEMLTIYNRVPLVTNQAEVTDKGRIPFRAKCVVATTNTPNLNAHAYFSCPLAIRRRMPFVVDCKPKEQYVKLGQMLDSSKVPVVPEGEIPDFWDFIIYHVTPVIEEQSVVSKRAQLVEADRFTSIHDFLAWVSRTAIDFEENEKRMEMSDMQVKNIDLCKVCYRAKYACACAVAEVQATDDVDERPQGPTGVPVDDGQDDYELVSSSVLDGMIDRIIYTIWLALNTFWIDRFIIQALIHFRFTRNFTILFLRNIVKNSRICRRVYGLCGTRVRNRWFLSAKMNQFLDFLVVGVSFVSIYMSLRKVLQALTTVPAEVQGNQASMDTGYAPTPREGERVNAWYKDDYQTTSFDVSPQTTSYARFNPDEVLNVLSHNCVSFVSEFLNCDGQVIKRTNRAVCLAGHVYMVNNHGIPATGDFNLYITLGPKDHGVTSNICIKVTQAEVMRYPEWEMATLYIRAVPPKKDITKLFVQDSFKGSFNATYLTRLPEGVIRKMNVRGVNLQSIKVPTLNNIELPMWVGTVKPEDNTVGGDCGSLMVAQTMQGPIITGVHLLGNAPTNTVCAARVTSTMVEKLVLERGEPIVQSGVPELSAPSVKRVVSSLHHKSTVRYLETGTANVYGSFVGFRQAPKSHVGPTIIADTLEKEGYQTRHGAPVMSGWEPWRIAIKEMTNPVTQMDTKLLEECADSFFDDIIRDLPAGWEDMLHVYDDFTAINGAAGVAYVDKLNRNTSAGNPWKKTKKNFMTPAPPRGENLEPVEVSEEIMERVRNCIATYHAGQRYMPNFCGQLKDEATTFKKILNKKTRVFCSGPVDWSITVRKYLLSSIRLIQNNRYVFEAAVGTNAHSLEWQEMREYLTKYGAERLVAGDYAAFDKSMSSTMILLAYRILYRLCAASGNYSELDLKVVAGIAEDTAFPLTDFNGDLIEFFGSNPSGHPLTVIINCLANSLYMRYCYAKLSPDKSPKTFKECVALITYGDDNAMGVHERAPWFNHTTIQETLARDGVTYTMADKEAESIPYIPIEEVSFLKRTWVFDSDIGAYVCPLEHDSIEKSLMVGVVSKTITQDEQAVAVMSSAAREYFWYGKQTFLDKRAMFMRVIAKHDLSMFVNASHFPTWDELYSQFWQL